MPRQSTKNSPGLSAATRYEDDLYTWVQEQVALLRAGRLAEVDVDNIAEELSDVGRSEFNALRSAIAVLTQHLLKWDYQSQRRSSSWQITIRQQRRQVKRILAENPGLKSRLSQALVDGYVDGCDEALKETGLPEETFPDVCPYSFDEMMTRPIVYEKPPARKRKQRRDK